MKNEKAKSGVSRKHPKWQTGPYSRTLELKLQIPNQLLLLCKIVNVTPEALLIDFMDNLSCSSWKREGRDEVKGKLKEYFFLHKYGQDLYSENELKEMFKEMDAIGMLFPGKNLKMIDVYVRWRKKEHKYWFNKWFRNNRRPKF